jgi:hypothetical protein
MLSSIARFALPVEAHPSLPGFPEIPTIQGSRPFNDLYKYCQWFYELEDTYPSDFKFGYWTDFLAVSPEMELSEHFLKKFF